MATRTLATRTATRRFPKVSLVTGIPGINVKLRELVPGELVVDGHALEHRSERGGTLRMDPVRVVSVERGVITIAYAEGAAIDRARFVDVSRGILRVRGTGRALASDLQQLFSSAVPPGREETARLEAAASTELIAAVAPIARKGRRFKWIGGILALVAAAATLLAINADSPAAFLFLFLTTFGWIMYYNGLRTDRSARKTAATARLATMSAGARRREEARRRARRKRQIKMYGIPAAIVTALLVVAVVVSLGGGTTTTTTPAKPVQTTGPVTVGGPPRSAPLNVGDQVPDFTANLLGGGGVRWGDYRGTPTVLALWAPWCPHCQKELPILARVAQGFPQVKVLTLVTAADLHPGPTVDGFLKSHNLHLATALDDEAGTLGSALGLQAFPTVYYVDAAGVVRHTIVGEASPEEMRANIQSLLG